MLAHTVPPTLMEVDTLLSKPPFFRDETPVFGERISKAWVALSFSPLLEPVFHFLFVRWVPIFRYLIWGLFAERKLPPAFPPGRTLQH